MLRQSMLSLALVLILAQLGLAQDAVKKEFEKAAAEWRPNAAPTTFNTANEPKKASDARPAAPPPFAAAQPRTKRPPTAPSFQPQPRRNASAPQGGSWGPTPQLKPVAPTAVSCIDLDVLIGCVVFDEKGELRVAKEGAEPEVNRAGTLGANLAAKLNEESDKLPAGVSPGAAGANFLLQGLAGEEKIESLEQFRLRLSSDGSEAHLQNGNRVPRIVGTSSRSGHITNSVQMESMGTLVGASTQITKTGKIALSLEIERSGFGPEEEGTPVSVTDDKTIRTPRIDTLTLNTQVSVADGESIVLSSLVSLWGDKVTETFVVVTGTVVEP